MNNFQLFIILTIMSEVKCFLKYANLTAFFEFQLEFKKALKLKNFQIALWVSKGNSKAVM